MPFLYPGARATLWVYPFINEDCEPYFTLGKVEGRFVTNMAGNIHMKWWNGKAASIDFTNATTTEWWIERIRDVITASGFDSVKCDAGD